MFTRVVRSKTQNRPSTATSNDDATPSHPLNIVSWNISSAQPSQVAPNPTLRLQNTPNLIREEVLRRQPDVIALQETASPSQGKEMFREYTSIGTKVALHTMEYVDLLIRSAAFSSIEPLTLPNLPAVGALLTYYGTKLAMVSIHLPHTREAAPLRQQLCQSLIQCIEGCNVDDIILIGDFNMRKDEDKSTEEMAGGLTDAWKEVTNMDKTKNFTWNSRVNLYHGPDCFKFSARFDRCYVRGAKVRLHEFDLVGNRAVQGDGDYLSDHYGLFVRCGIAISQDSSSNESSHRQSTSMTRRLHVPNVNDMQTTSSGYTLDAAASATGHHSAEELRRLRLQRFEATTVIADGNSAERSHECNTVVDLTEDSDDQQPTDERPNKRARNR